MTSPSSFKMDPIQVQVLLYNLDRFDNLFNQVFEQNWLERVIHLWMEFGMNYMEFVTCIASITK